MTKVCKFVVLFLAVSAIFALIVPACASEFSVASTDRIALGDWTYDAMAKLAGDGLVPGYAARVFEGDRLFDRMEMAEVVASVIKSSAGKKLSAAQTILIDKLVREFPAELKAVDPSAYTSWQPATDVIQKEQGFVTGHVDLNTAAQSYTASNSNASLSGFYNISDHLFAVGTLEDRRNQFLDQNTAESNPERAVLQGYSGDFNWSVGKEQVNWGPSYIGGLTLSDNAPSFPMIRASRDMELGWGIGWFKVTEFYGTFSDEGHQLFMVGRRWEKPLSNQLHLGVTEMCKTTNAPNPVIFVVPIYAYEYIMNIHKSDADFKAFYDFDLTQRWKSGNELYTEFGIFDITEPKFLFSDATHVRRRTALTLGFYDPHVLKNSNASNFRAEYTYIDPTTYTAVSPNPPDLAWTYDGDILGTPLGPNTDNIYLRAEQTICSKLSLIAEYLNSKQRAISGPLVGDQTVFSALLNYDLTPRTSVGFRVAPYTFTPYGQPEQNATLYQGRFAYTF